MLLFDLPLETLRTYTLPQVREPDFAEFWHDVKRRAHAQPLNPERVPVEYPVDGLAVHKVYFDAFEGGRICGWLIARRGAKAQPTLIHYHGYGGTKGQVYDYLAWALQGYTILAIDVRGQAGESADNAPYPTGFTTWFTMGILEPRQYYFVRAYADAIRAIDFVAQCDEVDPEHIGVTGASQGGALCLAASALDPRPKLCMSEVPGLCHFKRTFELTREQPWADVIRYFALYPDKTDTMFKTLSYVELNNFTDWIQCPTLISVGLVDLLCPPSTVFAVYNGLKCTKEIVVYEFSGHEVGAFSYHADKKLRWAAKYLRQK